MDDVDNSLLVESQKNYSEDSLCNNEIDNNLVYCKTCDVNFFDANELEQHNIEKHGFENKKHKCLYCDARFRRYDHLKRHMNNLHSTEENTLLLKCPNNLVYCKTCDVNFFDANELEQHNIEKHGFENKKLKCLYCDARFRRYDHLKRHMNSLHSTEVNTQLLKCPVCDEEFSRPGMVLKHVKKNHKDVQSFECRICVYKCTSLEDLESHSNTHRSFQRNHKCSYCKKPFKRRDHMLRHIKTVHLNQYTVCPICGQQFKRKDHVVRHCREKHSVGFLNGKIVHLENYIEVEITPISTSQT